jgi:hypothetical protein
MQPLGTLPPDKAKGKGKGDSHRRVTQGSNGSILAGLTPDFFTLRDGPVLGSRRSESRRAVENQVSTPLAKEPAAPPVVIAPPEVKTPTRISVEESPVPDIPATPRSIVEQAVQVAIKRSENANKNTVGLAIKQMFDDSARDPSLYRIIDAVSNRRATDSQFQSFKHHIRDILKQLDKPEKNRDRSSRTGRKDRAASSAGPVAPSSAPAGTSRSGKCLSYAHNKQQDIVVFRTDEILARKATANGRNGAGTKSTPRRRRASVASTSSELSSLSSDEQAADSPLKGKTQGKAAKVNGVSTDMTNGPTLHLFPTTEESATGQKRLHEEIDPEEALREARAATKKFRQDFSSIKPQISNIRPTVKTGLQQTTIDFSRTSTPVAPNSTYSTRSRNRAGLKRLRDDEEEPLMSPGETPTVAPLSPAALPSASRATTPSLGPPMKKFKKSARVKVS